MEKILVVDDELIIAHSIADYFFDSNHDYEFIVATGASKGIELAQKIIPDLIITDWNMPEMSGIELIKELKRHKKTNTIPIIVMSGIMTSVHDLKTALDAGAVDYLSKPLNETELFARVNSALLLSKSYKELYKQKKCYELLMQNSPAGIAILTVDGNLKDCNPIFKTICLSCNIDSSIGSNLVTALSSKAELVPYYFEKCLKNSETVYFDISPKYNDEQLFISVTFALIIQHNGDIVGIQAILEDITARKKSEFKLMLFKQAVEQSPASVVITDKHATIQYVNHAFTKITGYSQDEAVGLNPRILKPQERSALFYMDFWDTLTAGKTWKGVLKNVKKNGEYYWEMVMIAPIIDQQGEITHYIGVKEDISEQKNYEKKLRELNSTKDKLFSIIAHDLKAPFNIILGFSDLLKNNIEQYDKNKIKEFVTLMDSSARNGFNLLENLLEWARVQTGALQYSPIQFDINEAITENLKLLAAQASAKKIKLNADVGLPIIINADKYMINTVIRNLISNAIKFTHQDGKVNITTTVQDSNITVTVSDTGIGIAPETVEDLFKIDKTYSTRGTNNERGTGLGLSLCKEFIEKNGGKIWVTSQEGRGSNFMFCLPK